MKVKNLIVLVIFIFLFSCNVDYDLQKSVFIEDPDYKSLPQYSEWGYNTFGAYYDKKAFISNDVDIPMKIISVGNTTTFIFKGELRDVSAYSYYASNEGQVLMKFSIDNLEMKDYQELTAFDKREYNMLNSDLSISFDFDGRIEEVEILNGDFDFLKAHFLFVDNEKKGLILSGVFNFEFLLNDEPISISHGRFDMNINKENFFSF